jgi:hypothetical protein
MPSNQRGFIKCNLKAASSVYWIPTGFDMMLPSFLDVYLSFGLISVLHWGVVSLIRAFGTVPDAMPH